MYCKRHPGTETALTCATCGTPICPKCMVVTPVGMKCRDCGTNANSMLYQVAAHRLLLAAITALVAGLIAGYVANIGFLYVIFIAAPYGYFAGSTILKAAGMKRGRKLEIVTGVCMVLGGIVPKIGPLLLLLSADSKAASMGLVSLVSPFFWVGLVVATGCAISKIRYL